MLKMTLQRFRKIKERISEIVLLAETVPEEDLEKLEEELINIGKEIHESDLSEIPFEEYNGFEAYEFDFSGTNANIDFELIKIYGKIRAKGCNLKNLKFEKNKVNGMEYDEESFDEEIMIKYPEEFIDSKLPNDVKKRFYNSVLNIDDIVKYNLYNQIKKGRATEKVRKLTEKIDFDDINMLKEYLIDETITIEFINSIEKYDYKLTKEKLNEIILENIEYLLKKELIKPETYEKISTNQRIKEKLAKYFIEFPENEEIKSKYLNKKLELEDIKNNKEIFRNKKFLNRIIDGIRIQRMIKEEQLYYVFDNFPEISEIFINKINEFVNIVHNIDNNKSKEINQEVVQLEIMKKLNNDINIFDLKEKEFLENYSSFEVVRKNISSFSKEKLDRIMQNTSLEKIKSYNFPIRLFLNRKIVDFFDTYGFETIMEFDRLNGNVFSKNNFELAKKMCEYYLEENEILQNKYAYRHYEFKEKKILKSQPYTLEEFEEIIKKMIINGASGQRYIGKQPIDYRNFSKEFKEKNPELFIDENAPQELQDKFYTQTITINDISENPEWASYIEEKNLKSILKNIKYKVLNEKNEKIELCDGLKMIGYSDKEIFDLFVENNKIFAAGEFYGINSFGDINKVEDIIKQIEDSVENKILAGNIYGEPYILESFRKKYPEYVLDAEAPDELKKKFYSYFVKEHKYRRRYNEATYEHIELKDFVNEEYRKYLEGKSFDLLESSENVKNITKVFDIETITDLYLIDSEALELFSFNEETVNKIKNALEYYPIIYAKEEIMQELRLSEEEFYIQIQKEEIKNRFDNLTIKYYNEIVKNPGFVLNLEPENYTREKLKQYEELKAKNMLVNSNSYSRDTYEQILGNMLGFLGYEEAKKLLDVPKIDEETFYRIAEQDEIIKSLYERKYEIVGSLKTVTKVLEEMPKLLPTTSKITSKQVFSLFKSLNMKIMDGYENNIEQLIKEVLIENNVEINDEKIKKLTSNIIGINTNYKLNMIKDYNSIKIDSSIQENQRTKKMLKIQFNNALKHSLNKSEKIDIDEVRKYLENEFSKKTENGELYYSPHVTEHLEDLVNLANELNLNNKLSKKLNNTIVDDVKLESEKIGKGWIRKIVNNLCYKSDKIKIEELEKIKIYQEESGMKIDTELTIELKELSNEEKIKLYEILDKEEYKGLFSYGKAESMFSALKKPHSEKFKEYFLKYKEEFINDPELYTKFKILASKFDEYLKEPGINTTYKQGTLNPYTLLKKLSKETYPNLEINKGEHELIYQITQNGKRLTEEQALIALNLLKDMKKREYQTIPQEINNTQEFRGRILRMDDPLHFAIGEITECCQTIGNNESGESSMIHSATERNGALFIVEEIDEMGKSTGIISQSWVWRNGNRVCYDNVEISKEIRSQLKEEDKFDEVLEIYKENARKMIETDRKKLNKLLKEGKITKEEYDSIVIKDVTMGIGCDDLIRYVSDEKREELEGINKVLPLELSKSYEGSYKRTLYTDAKNAVLLVHNDEFAPDDHIHTNKDVMRYGVKYIKPRDVYRRRGLDIDIDKIESISLLVENNKKENSAFKNNPLNIIEIASKYGVNDLNYEIADDFKISMSELGDWYILYEEREDEVAILESAISVEKSKNKIEEHDKKMVLTEYTSEIYKILLESNLNNKIMVLDNETLEKYININTLIEQEILSVENGRVYINNPEKLKEVIKIYDENIENQRRERLLLLDENTNDEITR